MLSDSHIVDSPCSMMEVIRESGIIPLFRNQIPGWSIEEMTPEVHWFGKEEDGGSLGPWDWKIDCIREGDIYYGKFLQRKAAFLTREWFAHLMNYRRSIPRYRMAVGEDFEVRNQDDRMAKYLAPKLLESIRQRGTVESSCLKTILTEEVSEEIKCGIGGRMTRYLLPKVRKQAVDFLLLYLEMGTWVVTGDFERVRRGPEQKYSGWQRSFLTTPENQVPSSVPQISGPSWAKLFLDSTETSSLEVHCSPQESFEILISHISGITGTEDRKAIEKFVLE